MVEEQVILPLKSVFGFLIIMQNLIPQEKKKWDSQNHVWLVT